MAISQTDLLAHKVLLRQLRNRQRQENVLKDKNLESATENNALFFSHDTQGVEQATLLNSSMPLTALTENRLSELPFLSREMGVYVEVIAARLLAQNPNLEKYVANLTKTLDDLFDRLDSNDEQELALDELVTGIESALSEVNVFQAYIFLYEYYLKKKRSLKKNKKLELLSGLIDEMEENNALSIVENLKTYNQQTSAKLNLLRDVKSHANSYHGEYSNVIQQVSNSYDGNFKAMIKDLLRLNAHNSIAVSLQYSQSFEQNAFLLENVKFETKLLNLMSLFCKCEEFEKKIIKDLANYKTLQMSSDLVDLLDGFDCSRMVNSRCKSIVDSATKVAVSYSIIAAYFDVLRYLPSNFFKQEKDRENLSQRMKQCTFSSADANEKTGHKLRKYI